MPDVSSRDIAHSESAVPEKLGEQLEYAVRLRFEAARTVGNDTDVKNRSPTWTAAGAPAGIGAAVESVLRAGISAGCTVEKQRFTDYN